MDPAVEVGLESIASQIGTAVLDINDGKVVKTTGHLSMEDGRNVCSTLYKILQDSVKCIGSEPLRRICVACHEFNYVLTAGDKYVYIVKIRV